MQEITKETYLDWYENMQFWRKFEDCKKLNVPTIFEFSVYHKRPNSSFKLHGISEL